MQGLLSLPPEIRQMIFRLAVMSPTASVEPVTQFAGYCRKYPKSASGKGPRIYLTHHDGKEYPEGDKTQYISLSLLRTCRQIHTEISPFFWEMTSFVFNSPVQALEYYKKMGPMATKLIRRIKIRIFNGSPREFEGFLQWVQERAASGNPLTQLGLNLLSSEFYDALPQGFPEHPLTTIFSTIGVLSLMLPKIRIIQGRKVMVFNCRMKKPADVVSVDDEVNSFQDSIGEGYDAVLKPRKGNFVTGEERYMYLIWHDDLIR